MIFHVWEPSHNDSVCGLTVTKWFFIYINIYFIVHVKEKYIETTIYIFLVYIYCWPLRNASFCGEAIT